MILFVFYIQQDWDASFLIILKRDRSVYEYIECEHLFLLSILSYGKHIVLRSEHLIMSWN